MVNAVVADSLTAAIPVVLGDEAGPMDAIDAQHESLDHASAPRP